MSAIAMLRLDDQVIMLGDGGFFRSTSDFTLTGLGTKIRAYAHLPAVLGVVGFSDLLWLLDKRQNTWLEFDGLLAAIRSDMADVVVTCISNFGADRAYRGVILLGGYSRARACWETYTLNIDSDNDEWPDRVSQLTQASQLQLMPQPDESAFRRYGFELPNLRIDLGDDCLARLVRAQRATPQLMGLAGDPSDEAATGYTVGGFIEKVVVRQHSVRRDIIWQWPDLIGGVVDPASEGRVPEP